MYLTEEEKIGLSLRELYHNRSFTRVHPNRFEEYGLYEANKKFLETDNIVTFMGSDSRLMALKPDVTLSVVRGLPDNCDSRRLYYADDVYRFSSEQRAYKVLHQVGAEIFGTDEKATDTEAIALVLDSLDCISPHTSLAVSYLGEPSYDWEHTLAGDPRIRIDNTLNSDMDYYNGLIFRGYVNGMPSAVISGGRYDNLCRRLGKKTGGIGFAVTLNYLSQAAQTNGTDDYLNIALPKGRLGDAVCNLLIQAGLADGDFFAWGRKLILTDETRKMRYFAVKPSDVAVYVENGAADIGIVGSDVLEEYCPDVHEITDTGLGVCQMVVAAPVDFVDDGEKTLRIATKFPRTARTFFENRDTRIIHLNGSIELAPLLGLSDVIVDIVETGSTLKQNKLHIVNVIKPISARLIANRAAYQFKREAIEKFSVKR